MEKRCICGKHVLPHHNLCKECFDIYGARKEWPEWLKWLVSDVQREWSYENRHHDLEFFDETDFPNKKIGVY